MKRNILIVDDDLIFRRTLKYALQDDAASVYYAESAREAMICLTKNDYALIIMDTQLKEIDGIDMLSVVRQIKRAVPIMILTSNDNLVEQLLALEIGADIVLEKKADPLEYMVGHARALMLRNEERRNAASYQPMDLLIDVPARIIRVNGALIDLTRKEFDILSYMAGNPNTVLSRNVIYERIWGWEASYNVDDAVRYYIKTLRKKLSVGGKNYIETVHGVGYKLNPRGVSVEKPQV